NKLLHSPKGTTKMENPLAIEGNNRKMYCGPDAKLSFYTASVACGGSGEAARLPLLWVGR
ncbi:MAG: hypothetical protein ABSC95_24025, partial [Acetobacteraceae bacterium]